jgi:ferredoxin
MKVLITSDCVNCGLCNEIAPEIFRVNNDLDIAEVIRNPTSGNEEKMTQEAADSCPTDAIKITE